MSYFERLSHFYTLISMNFGNNRFINILKSLYPAPSSLNYTNNDAVFALFNSSLLGIVYFSSLPAYVFYLLVSSILFYLILYIWRGLAIHVSSFIYFLVNYSFLILFLFAFYNVSKGLPTPIYVENLSAFAYWRYSVFLCLSLLGLIVLFLLRYYPSISYFAELVNFPYLKHQIHLVLVTWEYSFVGDVCSKLLNLLLSSTYIWIFFSFHFFLFYIVGCIQTLLFCNFVFLHGDLRWNLYLLPLSFIIWILRFLEYHFFTFFLSSLDYLNAVLNVTYKNQHYLITENFVIIKPKDLFYQITPYGFSRGFTNETIVFQQWLEYMTVRVFYIKYKKYTHILSTSFLVINMISWSYIISSANPDILSTWEMILTRRSFSSTKILLAPRHMRHLEENYQYRLKIDTDGKHSPGHPVYGDFSTSGKFAAEGSVTHGTTHGQNSTELGIKNGDIKPTFVIPFDTPKEIDKSQIKNEIPGSAQFLAKPDIKTKLDNLHTSPSSNNPSTSNPNTSANTSSGSSNSSSN